MSNFNWKKFGTSLGFIGSLLLTAPSLALSLPNAYRSAMINALRGQFSDQEVQSTQYYAEQVCGAYAEGWTRREVEVSTDNLLVELVREGALSDYQADRMGVLLGASIYFAKQEICPDDTL